MPVAQNVHRQRATGLGGKAERAPTVAVAHEDGLDRMAVGGSEERLHRAVAGACFALERERRVGERRREVGAERRREVGHLLVTLRPSGRPGPDLTRAVRRLAALDKLPLEEVEIHRALTVAVASARRRRRRSV